MAKRQALGRGLSALLDNAQTTPSSRPIEQGSIGNVAGSIAMLRISQIEANPFQPRTKFDEVALNELAESISTLGIIQPITVRRVSATKYQLISGERRFRASQIAELDEIPAYIREADDQAMLEMALVENIQRENLDAIEVAISYQRLIEECNLTQDEMSQRVGKNRSTVSNYLRLLKLPAEIQIGIIEKQITMGHARALITVGDPKKQKKLFEQIVQKDLSVRQTEEMVRECLSGFTKKKPTASSALSFEQQKYQADLRLRLGNTVQMSVKEDGSGKIEIKFDSDEGLREIMEKLNS